MDRQQRSSIVMRFSMVFGAVLFAVVLGKPLTAVAQESDLFTIATEDPTKRVDCKLHDQASCEAGGCAWGPNYVQCESGICPWCYRKDAILVDPLQAVIDDLRRQLAEMESKLADADCPGAGGSTDRFTDCYNGTVRDNYTGLIWLKDASCADLPGTGDEGQADWETAVSAAANLADGICGLTDRSRPGDWRLPEITEVCSLTPPLEGYCPPASAADSLLNTNFSKPALSNLAGTGNNAIAFLGYNTKTGRPASLVWIDIWTATEVELNEVTSLYSAYESGAWAALVEAGYLAVGVKELKKSVWPVRGSLWASN